MLPTSPLLLLISAVPSCWQSRFSNLYDPLLPLLLLSTAANPVQISKELLVLPIQASDLVVDLHCFDNERNV